LGQRIVWKLQLPYHSLGRQYFFGFSQLSRKEQRREEAHAPPRRTNASVGRVTPVRAVRDWRRGVQRTARPKANAALILFLMCCHSAGRRIPNRIMPSIMRSFNRSHHAVIRVYDEAGNVIQASRTQARLKQSAHFSLFRARQKKAPQGLEDRRECVDKIGPKPLHLARYARTGSDSGNRCCCGNPVRAIGRSGRLAILSA